MSGTRGDDEHVRALLDQRAQRADVPPPHTRFSIFSDRSDSPSLYSHFDNNYRNTPTTPVPHFPRFHDNDAYDDRHEQYPPLSPKERLADPNASSLDLSEDTDACSESGSRVADPEDDSNLNPDSDEDPETRLSLMGPKMRVHSRAPWEEEEEGGLSEEDLDDGGNDSISVFGGKNTGRAVMRGLGFGSKSPVPKPSFDSSIPSKGKYSFETTSSVAASSTSRSAIHALAQASMSSTSLAIGPSSSSNRLPHKLSMGRLALNRVRSASGATSASDTNSHNPPLPSPRSAAYTERSFGRESPSPCGRRDSVSPNRSEFTSSVARARSPSPIPLPGKDGAYMHPYANPALLSVYQHVPVRNPLSKDGPEVESGHTHIARNDSVATLAASEETVLLTHSSSMASASVASTSGLESSTPPTSDFSLVSSTSRSELPRSEGNAYEVEKSKQQKRSRRETKLGPISAPSIARTNDFTATTPYSLISLEQAQARVKERNRSATTGAVAFPAGGFDERCHNDIALRARSSSATSKTKHPLPLLTLDNNKMVTGDLSTPISPVSSKQHSPIGPPAGKVLRPKRSGFMKLFNGRDKDKTTDIPPPVPFITEAHMPSQSSDHSYPPTTARPPKGSTHRVPVPTIPLSPTAAENKDDSRSKKSGPSLSIKVSSPPNAHLPSQDASARRSDSPKSLHPSISPKMPSSAPADMTQFPSLRLRPVSSFFSNNFAEHLLTEDRGPGSPKNTDVSSLISPTTIASSDLIPSPVNAGFNITCIADPSYGYGCDRLSADMGGENEDQTAIIAALKEQIRTSRKTWQRQIWELEGQVRDLRAEIDDMKAGDVCDACGRGGARTPERKNSNAGVIHRPRAKTGYGARFASGNEG